MRLVIDKVGGTINDILYLKSYGFGQVIFVVWIKFFSLEKHFSSDCYVALTRYLNLHWRLIYPNFDIFYPSGPTMVHIWAKLKLVEFYRDFSQYNFAKLIQTLAKGYCIISSIYRQLNWDCWKCTILTISYFSYSFEKLICQTISLKSFHFGKAECYTEWVTIIVKPPQK